MKIITARLPAISCYLVDRKQGIRKVLINVGLIDWLAPTFIDSVYITVSMTTLRRAPKGANNREATLVSGRKLTGQDDSLSAVFSQCIFYL